MVTRNKNPNGVDAGEMGSVYGRKPTSAGAVVPNATNLPGLGITGAGLPSLAGISVKQGPAPLPTGGKRRTM